MLKPVIEKDTKKIRQQIAALKWQLEQDIPEKDREIFRWTVRELEDALAKLEGVPLTKEETGSSLDILSSTAAGARMLIETIIESYGEQDFLQCIFFGLNEADQAMFLHTAMQKAGWL